MDIGIQIFALLSLEWQRYILETIIFDRLEYLALRCNKASVVNIVVSQNN